MAAGSMFDKFLLASVVLQAAWATTCTEGTTTGQCKTGKCVSIGEDRVCTECGKAGEVPINGVCTAFEDDLVKKTAKCTRASAAPLQGTDTVCAECGGDGYFLFMGGCYKKGEEPGNKICTTASGGKCDTCNAGASGKYVIQNGDPSAAPGTKCILCSDAAGANGYKGVAGCDTCTHTGSSAGTATCSACQAGYVKDANANVCKKCGDGCSTCSASNQQECTACLEGKYLNGNTCSDTCAGSTYADPKTNKCIQCATDIPDCQTCSYDKALQKPVCSACGGSKPLLKTATDGTTTCVPCGDEAAGVADCKTCTAPSGGKTKPVCSECSNFFLHTPAGGETSCEEACPEGYFGHTATTTNRKTCQSCATGASSLNPSVTGIEGCTSCTYTSSTLKCTACGGGKKPNKEGTGCFDCGISGCAYCSGTSKCEECGSGFSLEGGACVPAGTNLSPGAIAGISVAAVVVVGGLVGFLCWWFICRGKA